MYWPCGRRYSRYLKEAKSVIVSRSAESARTGTSRTRSRSPNRALSAGVLGTSPHGFAGYREYVSVWVGGIASGWSRPDSTTSIYRPHLPLADDCGWPRCRERVASVMMGVVRPTVLIVDDHEAFRDAARSLLETEGFEIVGEAGGGRDALVAADSLRPDVVLLDIQLPDLDGFAVADELAARRRRRTSCSSRAGTPRPTAPVSRTHPHVGSWPNETCQVRRSPGSSPERRRARAGLILLPAGLVVGILAERATFDWDDPRQWVPDLLVGLTFICAGAFAVGRRPGTGWLLAATGFAWFAGNFDSGLQYLHRGPLVHVIVAYAGWRARSRVELATIVIGYAAAVAVPVWDNDAVAIALVAGLVAVAVRSMRTATGRARSERRTALEAAVLFASVVTAFAVVTRAVPSGEAGEPMLLLYQAALGAIAVLLAAGLITPTSAVVADLVVELGDSPSGTLRDALAGALGDPTVEIGYWSPDGSYTDDGWSDAHPSER